MELNKKNIVYINATQFFKDIEACMQRSVSHAAHQFDSLQTGKASPQILENLQVEVYNSKMRIKDVASITLSDARTLKVQPWDKENLKSIEKGIQIANLGFNASIFGDSILCPIPQLSHERRTELVKLANKFAEEGKISARSSRREALECIKQCKKDGVLSEDDVKKLEKSVQNLTDYYVSKIEELLSKKTDDLMSI